MNGFTNAILSLVLGWLRSLLNAVWALLGSEDGGMLITLLRDHWKLIFLILCVGGFILDRTVYLIRWRPYAVWAARRRQRREERLAPPEPRHSYPQTYAPAPQDEPYPQEDEDEPYGVPAATTRYRRPAAAEAPLAQPTTVGPALRQPNAAYAPATEAPFPPQRAAYAPASNGFAPPAGAPQPPAYPPAPGNGFAPPAYAPRQNAYQPAPANGFAPPAYPPRPNAYTPANGFAPPAEAPYAPDRVAFIPPTANGYAPAGYPERDVPPENIYTPRAARYTPPPAPRAAQGYWGGLAIPGSPEDAFAPTSTYTAVPLHGPLEPEPMADEPRFDDDLDYWNAPQTLMDNIAPHPALEPNVTAGMRPTFGTSQPEPPAYRQEASMGIGYTPMPMPPLPGTPQPIQQGGETAVHPGLDLETFQQNIGLGAGSQLPSPSAPDAEAYPNFTPFPEADRPEPAGAKPRGLGALAKRARTLVGGEDERNPLSIRDLQSTVDVKNAFHAPVYPKKKPESEEE